MSPLCCICGRPRDGSSGFSVQCAICSQPSCGCSVYFDVHRHLVENECPLTATYVPVFGGICPSCKSANVRPYSYTEGGSGAGQSMACCLGCAFNPIAWLIIPFLQGKKKGGFECKYCSNRWSL